MGVTTVELGVRARLERIYEWYRGMVVAGTGRLAYLYDPVHGELIADGEPIREIASARDVARLGRFLGRSELAPVVERTVRRWEGRLRARDGSFVVEPYGEPPGIAHSAFLLLAMLETGGRDAAVRGLAEGILRQQRADGSLKVWFAPLPDDGIELYPGEALLALLHAHAALGDDRLLDAAERGAAWFRASLPPEDVASDLLVFFANWQSQYGALLRQRTRSEEVRAGVRDYLFALHDTILATGFYEDVAARPEWQACVQVACGLEGVVEAYAIAAAEGDRSRAHRYADAVRAAGDFLARAQRREGRPRERGGFGHSLSDRAQRIDVTGHAANGLMRTLEVGLEPGRPTTASAPAGG